MVKPIYHPVFFSNLVIYGDMPIGKSLMVHFPGSFGSLDTRRQPQEGIDEVGSKLTKIWHSPFMSLSPAVDKCLIFSVIDAVFILSPFLYLFAIISGKGPAMSIVAMLLKPAS
jgi:hypothetical protein